MATVLVTGATGFVGSWLVKNLVKTGVKVRVLHRPSSDLSELEGLTYESFHGDVTDAHSTQRACQGMDTVFHLAGVVAYTKTERALMERVNVQGTKNVVDALKSHPSTSLVYMSSVVAVGASFDGKKPLDENSPYNLTDLNLGYFETKRKAEEIVLTAAKSGRIQAVALCPSTIYGAADAKKGSRKIQLKVARGKFPFYTSGGVSIISVHDVIQGTLAAWEKGRNGERYILSGENLTIYDTFKMIARAAGSPPPHVFLPNPVVKFMGKVGDALEAIGQKGPLNTENAWTSILFHWFDNSKARAELALKPRPAWDAIDESVSWIKQQGLLDV